jgi:hypothetical protein
MTKHGHIRLSVPIPSSFWTPSGGVLQRKCACGGSSGLSGSCSECEKRKLLGLPLQTKLCINEPGDEYEQEADRVADQVMRVPATKPDGENPRGLAGSLIQREAGNGTGFPEALPIVHEVLSSPSQPLDAATRAFFEPRFGHYFGRVQVHVDSDAAESARAVHAHAYTVGSDIVFGAGQFAPRTREGQQLMAHELSHVVQPKREDLGQNTMQRKAKMPESPAKTEPPVDCTKEITTDYSCLDLIAEMSRHGFDMRENDSWIRRYTAVRSLLIKTSTTPACGTRLNCRRNTMRKNEFGQPAARAKRCRENHRPMSRPQSPNRRS